MLKFIATRISKDGPYKMVGQIVEYGHHKVKGTGKNAGEMVSRESYKVYNIDGSPKFYGIDYIKKYRGIKYTLYEDEEMTKLYVGEI